MKSESPIRVLIVEDHFVARMGLRTMIDFQKDMSVAAEARSGAEAVEMFQTSSPDVVLMDLRLPIIDGIAATELIIKYNSAAKVLVFSSFDAESDVVRAHAAGARGYVLKSADGEDLLTAIRSVAAGGRYFPQAMQESLLRAGNIGLSAREKELLVLLAKGLNNKEISDVTDITPGTVRIYLTRLFAKLQVSNRTEAVSVAFERGLVSPEWTKPQG
ncbi:MAG: response regulator transcription factor [Deltaproteobacteria bacterium]|nr:response regulator transcription factor [Deltaproteobacteria bacterium]